MDTLLIGLDGGEWGVLDPLIENGHMPNLKKLQSNGVSGDLQSTTPPVSAPAWNSILTGMNPGKHGIFDFVSYNKDHQKIPNDASNRSATPFWTVLDDHGINSGLFKVPFSHPPDDISGFVVAGFPVPSSSGDLTHPSDIQDRVGPIDDLFEDGTLVQESRLHDFHDNLNSVARHQTDGFLDLVEDFSIDFGMIVYDSIDRAQHAFWKYFDETHPRFDPDSACNGLLTSHYEVIDSQIGRILDSIDRETDIILISDHGFEQMTSYVSIDKWLSQQGLLEWESSMLTPFESMLQSVLATGWNAVGKLNAKTKLKEVFPENFIDIGREIQQKQSISWDETQAFFTTVSGQSILINLGDRFTNGPVNDTEYEECLHQVQRTLSSITHPATGEELIDSVIRGDEVFHGWRVEDAPDLIVLPKRGYSVKGGKTDSLVISSASDGQDRSGDHRKQGVLIASGPSLTTGSISDASVVDIVPTLLYLQQVPIPNAVDGKVLYNLFNPEVADNLEKQVTAEYGQSTDTRQQMTEQERSEVRDRLDDIGYL